MLSVAEKNILYTLIVTTLVGLTGMKTQSKKRNDTRPRSVKSVNVKYNGKYESYRVHGLRI